MSIRALYGMPDTPNMTKTAGGVLGAFGGMINWAHAKILAAAMLVGAGSGYALSKMTAKGKADIDTAKKSYQNERALADIGYLKTKLQAEYDASKADDEQQKSMRLI